jgi:Ca-activated chloride channel family protein
MRGPINNVTCIRGFVARSVACILLSSLGAAVCGEPQDKTGTASREAYPSSTTILVHSDLVQIPVTVLDGSCRVVSGLEKEHFTLFEDKVQQTITHFAAEDAPASIGLVFDTSDSMGPRMNRAHEAVEALLKSANPADEFFLVQFSSHAILAAGMTNHSEEISRKVAMTQVGGSTALLDAVALAMDEMKNAHYLRKAIVIISDGDDNSSRCSVNELKKIVREGDVLIYAIGINDDFDYSLNRPPYKLTGPALLNEIATQTGGRLFEVRKLKQLPDITAKISGWLRSQYVLGYASENQQRDGQYRRVQIKLARPKGFPRLHAFWRLGYYAPNN